MLRILYSLLLMFAVTCVHGQLQLDIKHVKCKGEKNGKITVTGVGSAAQPIMLYSWSTGNTGKDMTTQANLSGGTYKVTVTDANGCTASATAAIEEPLLPLKIIISTSSGEFFTCGDGSIIVTAIAIGGTPPVSLNGSGPVWSQEIRTSSFGGGPKVLTFIAIDDHGCKVERKQGFAFSAISCASDPNDISGPVGVDSTRWVSSKERMAYLVRFENDPVIATAPAQEVRVTVPVPEHINPFSLQLDDFGWGPYSFDIPANSTFYQTRLDLTDSLGLFVDVTAGLDVNENAFFWVLSSVDPATGFLPVDPQIGFLPVNDTSTASGEGFMNFSILPDNAAVTGDTVFAQAEIIFDVNESIFTNIWSNVLDALPPISTLAPFSDTTEYTDIQLSISGNDDPGGVGIQEFALYVSIDSGVFNLVAEALEPGAYTFAGEPGRHYRFFSRATDRVGNEEPLKTAGEASVQILPSRVIDISSPATAHHCIYDSLEIAWSKVVVDSVMVEMSLDSGMIYFELLTSSTDTQHVIFIEDTMITNHAIIRITDLGDSSVVSESAIFGIHGLPAVEAGEEMTICEDSTVFLGGSGANSYLWSPDTFLNNASLPNPRVSPDFSIEYFMTGTDVFGCQSVDSVMINVTPFARDSTFIEICIGDSVLIGGEWQDTTGYYTEVFPASNQCDSLFITHLLVHDPCIWPGGDIVYVDWTATGNNDGTSWADAFNKLSDALFYSNLFDNIREIWVTEGIYIPGEGMDREISFVFEDSTKVYGGFEGTETMKEQRNHQLYPVFLSGDIGVPMDSSDNVLHVVTIDSTCIGCRLDGLTIQFGYAKEIADPDDRGAGLHSTGVAQLKNVTIEQNQASIGAAITHRGMASQLIVEDCVIRLNTSDLSKDVLNIDGAILELRGANTIQE